MQMSHHGLLWNWLYKDLGLVRTIASCRISIRYLTMQISLGQWFFWPMRLAWMKIYSKPKQTNLCTIDVWSTQVSTIQQLEIVKITDRLQEVFLNKANFITRCSDQWFLLSKTCPRAACLSNWQYTKQLSLPFYLPLLTKWLSTS